MARFFNTAGPCKADIHYMLPPLRRLPGVERLVDGQLFFVVHAPRQSGKTTAVLQLARDLTDGGKFAGVMLSVEVGESFDTPEEAEPAVLQAWSRGARWQLPETLRPPTWPEAPAGARLLTALGAGPLPAPRRRHARHRAQGLAPGPPRPAQRGPHPTRRLPGRPRPRARLARHLRPPPRRPAGRRTHGE